MRTPLRLQNPSRFRVGKHEQKPLDSRNDRKTCQAAASLAACFTKLLFGGCIEGATSLLHQFNVIDDEIFDLNANAADTKLHNAYSHDESFIGNEDHVESRISCVPRVLTDEVFEQIGILTHMIA